jgi:activator of 2-hydroxyglutaryl-CoA dehydratase
VADKRTQAQQMRGDVPSTIARSDDKAVRTYKKTLESGVDGGSRMTKAELVEAIERANRRATDRARS